MNPHFYGYHPEKSNFPGEPFFKEKGFPEPLRKTFKRTKSNKRAGIYYRYALYLTYLFCLKVFEMGVRGKNFCQKVF
ncbi:MAG: hypothetical protein IJV76_07905, partial [Clostridia bacterium]|nr:hypothetical protein [Clostridia bacterium]